MNRIVILLTAVLVYTNCIGQSFPEQTAEIVSLFEQNKVGKVHKYFDKKTKKAFKKIYLIGAWKGLQKNSGNLKEAGEPAFSSVKNLPTATVPLHFEKASFNLVLTGNDKNEIVGLRFAALAYETPVWAKNKTFGKERIKVKTDSFIMPGELLLPENCNQCPVVVLVHGSGPSDRNEGSSISPNRLFQDLAYGFALNGIATIRYDKRTFVYGSKLSTIDSFTLYDETIADAISAVNLAKTYQFLDTTQVYVLGHSLGAYASPQIAANVNVAGIVMLAGPHRPLYEVIPEQYEYLFGLDGEISKKEAARIHTAKEEVKFINGEKSEVDELKIIGDNSVLPYFRDMKAYNPAETIKNLTCKVLITQGDRDYQVRYQSEYNTYVKLLESEHHHVDFHLIQGVNHQLIWGDSPSTPNEYYLPGHPSLEVISYFSDWIKQK